jgi:SAM-dependent methyltransferase
MIGRPAERWRPPGLAPSRTRFDRARAAVRRFFDVQNGSIWRDLAAELAGATGTVLDVGCGAQPYRSLIPPTATYLGIDTADAKTNFGYDLPDDATYYAGERFPIDDASASLVLCTETLEHVPNPSPFLREVHRCLAPGGRLVLTVPFAARYHFIPFDYYRYTPASLNRLLADAGFADRAVYARGNPVTVAAYKCMALLLPLLLPQRRALPLSILLRLMALPFIPPFVLLAVVANLSLCGRGGDDCLGYTVLARKPESVSSAIIPQARE